MRYLDVVRVVKAVGFTLRMLIRPLVKTISVINRNFAAICAEYQESMLLPKRAAKPSDVYPIQQMPFSNADVDALS